MDEDGSCPICGAPQGACTGEGYEPDHLIFGEWGNDMDRPQMNNPVGPSRIVRVSEEIYEDVPLSVVSTSTTKRLKHGVGALVTVQEAIRLGIPLMDANGNAIDAEQAPKPEVETQDVKGPVKRQDIVAPKKRSPRKAKPKAK